MSVNIYITGLGIISAIGKTVIENLESLKQQQTGIGQINILETKFKNEFPAGEIKLTNQELSKNLNLVEKNDPSRNALLAMTAAKEAIDSVGLRYTPEIRTGLIAGTTVGGMDKTEKYYLNPGKDFSFIKTDSCGAITEYLAQYLRFSGIVTTINTACSSSANAIMYGARLIQAGILDRVIVGGYDSLSKFTFNGFRSLFILSPDPCQPFDRDHKGLNLGEAAGFVILESEKTLSKTGNSPLCRLSGFANTNDAYHQTASSPNGEGAFLCMNEALNVAKLMPGDIDYINVHGTGTENNDLSEGIAMKRLFGTHISPFSSTKSFTGHTLGAAGAIEAVFSVLSIQHQLIFPNLFFEHVIEELQLYPESRLKKGCNLKNVMSNSFGFGGNNTTLIFSKV